MCPVTRGIALALALLAAQVSLANAQRTSGRPDGHAPIGVTLDHTHEAGEFMFSYRYMYMQMKGLLDGTSAVTASDVVDPDGYGFMVAPTEMPVQMHMFGLMLAPTSNLTLLGMLPFFQDLNGPQLETDWQIVLGAQYAGDTGLFGGE